MRTNVVLDDELMAKTMKATGKTTKRAAIEEAMRRTVRNEELKEALERLRGIGWAGDLDKMREGWAPSDWALEDKQ